MAKLNTLFDKDFKEILSSQSVSILIGLIAGIVLVVYTDKLLFIPGILIMLPGFLEMRGNISGSFASRLSSGLFLGMINPKKFETHIVKGNLIASFFLAIFISFILGLLAFIFNLLMMCSGRRIEISLVVGLRLGKLPILAWLQSTYWVES